jgi:4-amino-4-deoxy-L-arabinose transferase-like glycosyltransferase
MDPELGTQTRKGRTYALLASAILLAAAVRLYLFWQYHCISSDGLGYINAAQGFLAGRIAEGLTSFYPPAYPVLIASLYPLVDDWEAAGQLGSILAGVLVLLPLYVLCRRIYGEDLALIACFLAASAPFLARYSVHVRSESLFIFFTTLALVLFHRGIERALWDRFFYGGLIAGVAYLVRPEAIGFLAIIPAMLGIRCWVKKDRGVLWVLAACLLLLAGFFLLALPYIHYLSLETGQWGTLSRKAGPTLGVSLKESGLLDAEGEENLRSLTFIGIITNYPLTYMKKVAMDLVLSGATYLEALHYSYVPFVLTGLFALVRQRFWERKDFLLLVFVVFYVVGFALIYVNLRYAVQLVPASLGWTAGGLLWCWNSFKQSLSPWTFRMTMTVGGTVFIIAALAKTLSPIAPEKAHIREAGRYLGSLKGSSDLKLLVFDDRIAFYAGAKPVFLADMQEQSVIKYLKEGGIDYLATEVKPWQERYPTIARDPRLHGLILEKEFRAPGKGRLLIFKVKQKEKS